MGMRNPEDVGPRDHRIGDQRFRLNEASNLVGVRLRQAKFKRAIRLLEHAALFSILSLLPACGIPKLRQADPGACLPESYPAGLSSEKCPAQAVPPDLNSFFADPVLIGLIDQGIAGNQTLKILNEEVQVARNEVLSRRGAYLPFVALRGRGGLDKHSLFTPEGAAEEQLTYPGERSFPDPLTNTLLAADIFWRVDIWRELRNARDAARARYAGAIERRNYFVTELVADIADSYFELASLDKRLEYLNQTIGFQQQARQIAEANKQAGRSTELGVQRFQAEVRRNESERLIVRQRIIEAENRINFLLGRYPQPVNRVAWDNISLDSRIVCAGLPSQLLQNRRDIREAERELAATGLDIRVARARFFPRLDITGGIGYEAFSPKYLFNPEAFIVNIAGELVTPLINKKAIKADFRTANARQLQALYNYQRTILNAFTEVVNRLSEVQNYGKSLEIKRQQIQSLETSVEVANKLFQNARAEYVEVLLALRDLLEARTVVIETKRQQLSAIVNAYQALGGGFPSNDGGQADLALPVIEPTPPPEEVPPEPALPGQPPIMMPAIPPATRTAEDAQSPEDDTAVSSASVVE